MSVALDRTFILMTSRCSITLRRVAVVTAIILLLGQTIAAAHLHRVSRQQELAAGSVAGLAESHARYARRIYIPRQYPQSFRGSMRPSFSNSQSNSRFQSNRFAHTKTIASVGLRQVRSSFLTSRHLNSDAIPNGIARIQPCS